MTQQGDLPWMPVSAGFELKLLRGGGDDDARTLLLRLAPGTFIPLHRHSGEVHAFNVSGRRLLIEARQEVGPGGYVYEPPGNVDSWQAVGEEPVIVLVIARGAMETFGQDGQVVETSTTSGVTAAWRRFLESRA